MHLCSCYINYKQRMAQAPTPGVQLQSQGTAIVMNWMPCPEGLGDCPPGLEYLTQIDQLLVNQKVELFEVLTGWETSNKYSVKNTLGQQVYFAAESSECLTRQYCGASRPFEMSIFDNSQREVIHLVRPLRCASWCCFCCLQEMEVQSPPGTTIGWIKQDLSFLNPIFSVQNAQEETILKIRGPCFNFICTDIEFQVLSLDGSLEVGKITKQWSGLAKEFFTDADNFGIQFPMDLDVKAKATMLGACFLIDFMYFEQSNNNNGVLGSVL